MGVCPPELGLAFTVVGEPGGAGRGRLTQQSSSFTEILPRKVTTTSQNTSSAGTRHLIHKAVGEILSSNYNILPLTQMAHGHLLCPFSSYRRVHKILIVPTFFKGSISETLVILEINLAMNPYQ